MSDILNVDRSVNPNLGITCVRPNIRPDNSAIVSQAFIPVVRPYFGGPNGRMFDGMRRSVAERTWRITPNIPGLSLMKRTILFSYDHGLIRTVTAQRLIDRTKSWEA